MPSKDRSHAALLGGRDLGHGRGGALAVESRRHPESLALCVLFIRYCTASRREWARCHILTWCTGLGWDAKHVCRPNM